MLRARRVSSSAAASALEALFGQAKVLTTTLTGNLQSTSTSSAAAAFSSSASSQQPLFVPWTSRGECFPSTSTGGEEMEVPIGAAFAGEPALIIGGRRSESSTLSPSSSALHFAAASPFRSSLWQQQRRWMAVPKKKVREKIQTKREGQ